MECTNPWKRLGAYFIDYIIIGIPMGLIGLGMLYMFWVSHPEIMTAIQSNTDPSPEFIMGIYASFMKYMIFAQIASACVYWLYSALLESSVWQATLGKKIFKIKVVGKDGQRISFGRASARFFGKFVSSMVWPIFIAIFFMDHKQALHDLPADTYVIDA